MLPKAPAKPWEPLYRTQQHMTTVTDFAVNPRKPHMTPQSSLDQMVMQSQGFKILLVSRGRLVNRERGRLLADVTERLESGQHVPGLKGKDGLPGKAALLTQQRSLKLLDAQRRLRQQVEQQQQEIAHMDSKSYKRFSKEVDKERVSVMKKFEAIRASFAPLQSIFRSALNVKFRREIEERKRAATTLRQARNRGVDIAHKQIVRERLTDK